MVETKLVVSGKSLSMKEYFDLMKQAKEATVVYKESPAFAQEQKEKEEMKEQKERFYQQFADLGRRLNLSKKVLGSIGYKLYLESKEE